jgi:beta-phosphoglucomutase
VPLKALVFDCDGVLVDTEPLHYRAFQTVLGPLGLGHTYEHYLQRYIGFDDRDAFLEAFKEGGRPIDDLILAQLIRAKETILQGMIALGISSFPGVVALVRELAAHRVPLAVASGALRHEVEAFLKGLELSEYFPVIVAADDVDRSKPDPETYLKVLSHLKEAAAGGVLEPGACIAIEDTPAGVRSAKAAGLYVIGVTNSFASARLDAADHVVASLEELSVARLVQLLDEQRSLQSSQRPQPK